MDIATRDLGLCVMRMALEEKAADTKRAAEISAIFGADVIPEQTPLQRAAIKFAHQFVKEASGGFPLVVWGQSPQEINNVNQAVRKESPNGVIGKQHYATGYQLAREGLTDAAKRLTGGKHNDTITGASEGLDYGIRNNLGLGLLLNSDPAYDNGAQARNDNFTRYGNTEGYQPYKTTGDYWTDGEGWSRNAWNGTVPTNVSNAAGLANLAVQGARYIPAVNAKWPRQAHFTINTNKPIAENALEPYQHGRVLHVSGRTGGTNGGTGGKPFDPEANLRYQINKARTDAGDYKTTKSNMPLAVQSDVPASSDYGIFMGNKYHYKYPNTDLPTNTRPYTGRQILPQQEITNVLALPESTAAKHSLTGYRTVNGQKIPTLVPDGSAPADAAVTRQNLLKHLIQRAKNEEGITINPRDQQQIHNLLEKYKNTDTARLYNLEGKPISTGKEGEITIPHSKERQAKSYAAVAGHETDPNNPFATINTYYPLKLVPEFKPQIPVMTPSAVQPFRSDIPISSQPPAKD